MSQAAKNTFIPGSLQRLNVRISDCNDPSEQRILLAKRAALLAKYSYNNEATSIVAQLRQSNSSFEPRLSAWIMFTEGLIEHFETPNSAKAKDKFVRSHLIGQVARDRELAGASAAWLANCYFVEGRLKESAEHLTKAFEWSESSDGGTQGRACLVLADAFSMGGDSHCAKRWYQVARMHAVAEGDIAMQNVVLFNSTAFHVSSLTLTDCVAKVDERELKLAGLELSSAANLNAALGIGSLPSMLPIMRADLLVIQRCWSAAAEEYSKYIPNLIQEGQPRQVPKALAQRAWCRANLNDKLGAISDTNLACESASQTLDFDDLSIVHFRLSETGREIGEKDLNENHQLIGRGYYESFRSLQTEIKSLFGPVAELAAQKDKNPA